VSTLPNPAPAAGAPGAYWQHCAGCDVLLPVAPGQLHCRLCGPARLPGRCPVAHDDDRSPCVGPPDAVRVVDRAGEQRYGCVVHAAVALASIEHARVYPGSLPGAAVEAYCRARQLRPFEFAPDGPWPASERCTGWGGR
jgi:hypothetical protein